MANKIAGEESKSSIIEDTETKSTETVTIAAALASTLKSKHESNAEAKRRQKQGAKTVHDEKTETYEIWVED